jgi:prepilin-type N-terminal cleavage/methylation domain-containing protein
MRARAHFGAFTLIEVLATLVLIGIVIPVAMRGVSVALAAAENAKHSAEAASIGEAKLNELIATGDWTVSGTSGDFGPDWPDYHWTLQTAARDFNVTEITLTVNWQERARDRSLNISTMIADSSSATGTSTIGAAQ